MSDLLNDKTPIRARHIRPGQGQAVEVMTGQLLEVQAVDGQQVADFVAFTKGDTEEHLSTSVTRSTNANIIPQVGMTLYSNRRQPMFEIVADTVGRHDMLYACCDPLRYEQLGAPGHASCREALADALRDYGIGYDRIPSPINWFMNVSIMQRGQLEIREPLAEKGDHVVLRALKDVIAAVSACPQDLSATNAFNPTDIAIRVYRDESLPVAPEMVGGSPSVDASDADSEEASLQAPDAPSGSDVEGRERSAERRATRRAERQAAAAAAAESEIVVAEPEVPSPTAAPASRPARLQDTAEGTVIRVENPGDDETP